MTLLNQALDELIFEKIRELRKIVVDYNYQRVGELVGEYVKGQIDARELSEENKVNVSEGVYLKLEGMLPNNPLNHEGLLNNLHQEAKNYINKWVMYKELEWPQVS